MEFAIPTCKDELLSRRDARHYVVEDLFTVRQIVPAVQAFKSACHGNPNCIVEHFDTLFSVLCLLKDVDTIIKEDTWVHLLKGCKTFCRSLSSFLDQSDISREERVRNLNALKMACYLLCQFMEAFDGEATQPSTVVVGKGRGKKAKPVASNMNMDWDSEKLHGVEVLLSFIELSLNKLWDPPVAEEEFVSLVSTCCYKLLENPSVTKLKDVITVIAHILGNLVKRYNHGLSASVKIDQLLKHFEFLTPSLVQIVEVMVTKHGCKSIITEILREIGNSDTKEAAKDTTAAKAYASFLVELSEKLPSTVLPSVYLVIELLERDSYTLRNGVLGMMGEIITKYLSTDTVDEKLRVTRDMFFDKLEDHMHDTNAFVRSKVLQIWLNIVTEKCLPLLRQETVMTLAVGRLNDKSSIVRRHALQLITTLIKSNPFASKLPVEDLRTHYEKEKAQLDEMAPKVEIPLTPRPVDDKVTQDWLTIEEQLVKGIKAALAGIKLDELASVIGEEDTSDEVLGNIVKYLEGGEVVEAITLTLAAMESFPDLPVFVEHDKKPSSDDEAESTDNQMDTRKILSTLKEVFFWVKRPLPLQEVDISSSAESDQNNSELTKQQTLVQYLKNSLSFATQVQQCIPIICQLLGSKNTSDVFEAIQFFVAAVEFGVSSAIVGIRRMMVLIWSQEATVREAVVNAYKSLYLESKEKNQKSFASTIVKNLSSLLAGSAYRDLLSLEAMVCEFVKSGHIGQHVIKALWERFTMKSEAFTAQDARCAVHLIAMCAQAEPNIIKSNVEVLIQEGLGPRADNDYLLAVGTCQALLKLTVSTKEKGKPAAEPLRFPQDHDLFERLKAILLKGVKDTSNQFWVPLAEQAFTIIYNLCDTPDVVCADLLTQLLKILNECAEVTAPKADGDDEPEVKSDIVSCVLTRVLAAAGLASFRQMVFLEDDVLGEMKRRLAVTEENKKGANRRKSKGGSDKAAELEEDMALAGASAEDAEAEYVKKVCEVEILGNENFFSAFQPLIEGVCRNSAKYNDPGHQIAAAFALSRFMIISSEFCESHLQLLFTLLEKSPLPTIRANLIIALGDLTIRFPNLVEPWTSHLYGRLRDDSPFVRKTTLQVLTHLILNDMIKVKGQISELATCIVDMNETVSALAKLFFHEFAKKGNSMYNMPDIISRLSDPDTGVEENHFQIIIKYIFSHIEKSKHCESLAEKLCHRFRGTRTDRQVRDLSFCLSQLSYSEKAIAKLLENFPCYADKLVDNDVYGHFCQIISKSKQFMRPEARAALEELESKIEQAHTKGLEDGEVVIKAATTKTSVCVKGKGRGAKTPVRRKQKKVKESDSENEEDENIENISPLKPKKVLRGQKKVTKARFTLDSSDEDDEALFDMGKEGEVERDLDDDDSFVTKPSQKKSKKGKVPLTPV